MIEDSAIHTILYCCTQYTLYYTVALHKILYPYVEKWRKIKLFRSTDMPWKINEQSTIDPWLLKKG
jgi:hypothetical protein